MDIVEVAGGVIRNEAGELLLLHRNQPHLVQWELPGGKIESGESAEVATVREMKEELGIDVKIIRKIGDKMFDQIGKTWRYHWFEVVVMKGEPVILEPELFDKWRFLKMDDLSQIQENVSPNVLNLVEKLNEESVL